MVPMATSLKKLELRMYDEQNATEGKTDMMKMGCVKEALKKWYRETNRQKGIANEAIEGKHFQEQSCPLYLAHR